MNRTDQKVREDGFSLVELMVVLVIFVIFMGVVFMTMMAGHNSWTDTATAMDLRQNIRLTLDRVSDELRESGSAAGGTMEVTINNNVGVNGSDVLRFSIPVICEASGSVMDTNGDVAHWGAPLTWGCTDSTCMDADNDCTTVEYSFLQYSLNAQKQLVRSVVSPANAVVRTDIFAQDITDFQAALSADNNIVTLTVTASGITDLHRTITMTDTLNVYLRNRG